MRRKQNKKPGPKPKDPAERQRILAVTVQPETAQKIESIEQNRSKFADLFLSLCTEQMIRSYNRDPEGFISRFRSSAKLRLR